jgi:EAL domain-containing protein (putative c-di-GMP-specific phosphodiesterase class I)
MTTTVEDVQTEEQNRLLKPLGCDEGQGYLFSAAVPIEQIGNLLDQRSKGRELAA